MDAFLSLETRLLETLEETKALHRDDSMQRDEIAYKLKEVERNSQYH